MVLLYKITHSTTKVGRPQIKSLLRERKQWKASTEIAETVEANEIFDRCHEVNRPLKFIYVYSWVH